MTEASDNALRPESEVQILLTEYGALKTAIMNRTTHLFQMGAASAAVIVWVLGRPASQSPWMALGLSAQFVTCIALLIHRDIGRAARRVAELESTVTQMAGKELLAWELRHGGAARGWLFRRQASTAEAAIQHHSSRDFEGE